MIEEWSKDQEGQETVMTRKYLNKAQTDILRLHRQCAIWWLGFFVLVPPLWFLVEYGFVAEHIGVSECTKQHSICLRARKNVLKACGSRGSPRWRVGMA